MRSLSAKDIVGVWEHYEHQAPMRRALAVIGAACPELSAEEIAHLSIGRRDLLLLIARRHTLGTRLEALAECPVCAERAEFTLDAADIAVGSLAEAPREFETSIGEYTVRFRLLDSSDLAAAGASASVEEARFRLIERAVLDARCNRRSVAVAELPESVIGGVADAISEHDPQAEVLLDLVCAACGHAWQVLFDIVSFLWGELRATAFELLRDVHFIAGKYGWTEDAILAMSATKRKLYLEL